MGLNWTNLPPTREEAVAELEHKERLERERHRTRNADAPPITVDPLPEEKPPTSAVLPSLGEARAPEVEPAKPALGAESKPLDTQPEVQAEPARDKIPIPPAVPHESAIRGFGQPLQEEALEGDETEETELQNEPEVPQVQSKPEPVGTRLARAKSPKASRVLDPFGPINASDVGNSIRFAKDHSTSAKYVPGLGWEVWDGVRWRADDKLGAHRNARSTIRKLAQEANAYPRDEDRNKWLHHALASECHSRIVAMVEQARSQPGIAAEASLFDADPWLLNVANGVLDLRTGKLAPHDPAFMLTQLAPVPYIPAARCPHWEKFLQKAMEGDAELIGFLQRAFGYSLTGSTQEDAVFILYGPTGSNGKTTLLEAVVHCLGSYAGATDPNTFFMRKDHGSRNTPELAKLRGVRLVESYEAAQGACFDEARLKALTGGDVIQAAAKYKDPIEYRPQFKVWFRTNHLPQVDPHDEGVWRRVLVIPFQHQFVGAELDKTVRETLPREEGAGILAWMVRGALAWQAQGLNPPERVTLATKGYRSEQEDSVALWLERCTAISPNKEPTFGLYKSYRAWCEAPDQGLTIEDARIFARVLEGRGFARTRHTAKGLGYFGIEVLPSARVT